MDSSRFFSAIVGCMFLTVCAYIGAELYRQLDSPLLYTVQTEEPEALQLQGIVLRQELSITLERSQAFSAQSGQRLAAGELLTLDSKGQGFPAPCSGIFYDSTDGFEYLNVDNIDLDDISALEALLDLKPEAKADGRLVTDIVWYYWAKCDTTAALAISGSHKIQFDGFTGAISARVISDVTAADGRHVLLLRLNRGGNEYLSLRKVGAVIIGYYET